MCVFFLLLSTHFFYFESIPNDLGYLIYEQQLKAASGSHSLSLTSVTLRHWVLQAPLFSPNILEGAQRFPWWLPAMRVLPPPSGDTEGWQWRDADSWSSTLTNQFKSDHLSYNYGPHSVIIILQALTCLDLFFFNHLIVYLFRFC